MKFFIFLFLLISISSIAEDDHHDHDHGHDNQHENSGSKEKKSLDAHVHGVSILNIAQDINKLSFEFEMPGFDVVGFEYKAKKKEDIKKVKNALNVLSDYRNMFILSENGECSVDKSTARVINEGSHSEFASEYILNCKSISQLKELEIKYQTLEKEKEILSLKEEQIIKESELQRQRTIKKAFLIGFLVVLLPIIGLLAMYFQKLKTQVALNKSQEEVNTQKVYGLMKDQELKSIPYNFDHKTRINTV